MKLRHERCLIIIPGCLFFVIKVCSLHILKHFCLPVTATPRIKSQVSVLSSCQVHLWMFCSTQLTLIANKRPNFPTASCCAPGCESSTHVNSVCTCTVHQGSPPEPLHLGDNLIAMEHTEHDACMYLEGHTSILQLNLCQISCLPGYVANCECCSRHGHCWFVYHCWTRYRWLNEQKQVSYRRGIRMWKDSNTVGLRAHTLTVVTSRLVTVWWITGSETRAATLVGEQRNDISKQVEIRVGGEVETA